MSYYKGMGERCKLSAAYTATHYRVFTDPPFVLRVGEASAALDALLASDATDTWALITACNPGSVPLSPAENADRMNQLRDVLNRFTTYPGESSAPTGEWAEPSVLVLGMGRSEAVQLAKAFGQNAILAGERGGPAELVWV